jgi:hypothetical protein
MENESPRRSFFGKVALAGAAAAAAGSGVRAQTRPKLPSTDLLRIGAIALGDNSHMNYEIWAPMFNQKAPKTWPVGRTTRMLITHCWDSRPKVAQDFAQKYGCEAVKNYSDMVGKVDGMVFAGFNECWWWPKLVKPYLEAGIPCFINRPFAYSMKDARYMVELSKKYNAPILCTDTHEYLQQTYVGRAKVEELLSQGRSIIGAHSTNPAAEYPAHGIHGLYYLLAVLGMDIEEAGLQADGWLNEITPTAKNLMTWGQIDLRYRGVKIEGKGESKAPFLASQLLAWPRADITFRLYHDLGWWDVAHENTAGDGSFPRLFFMFFNSVLAMQRMFETRVMPQTHDYILKKTQIFLTAFKSHLEHNGALIPVDSLSEDWTAPNPHPGWIDERIFG